MSATSDRRLSPIRLLGRGLTLATAVLLGACESPTASAPGPEPLLQTGTREYAFQATAGGAQELTVPYTFSNRTPDPVSLGNCEGVFSHGLERLTPRGWERSWSATVLLCHSEPIRIAPGATWSGELLVRAVPATALSGAEMPLAEDLGGTYRLVWDLPVALSPGGEEVLAKELRVSNPFQVRLP